MKPSTSISRRIRPEGRLDFLWMLSGKSFSMEDPKDLTAKGKPSIDPGATYTFELGLEGDIFGHESFREHVRGII